MMKVSYVMFNGEIICEVREGVVIDYAASAFAESVPVPNSTMTHSAAPSPWHHEEQVLFCASVDRHRRCDWRREVAALIADWNDEDYVEHV